MGATDFTADFDYSHHQYRRRILQVLPGGIRLDAVGYFKDGMVTTAYPGGQRMTQSSGQESAIADGLCRFVPALFAQRALKNISSATYVGRKLEAGKLIDIVEVSWDQSTRMRAHLDSKDQKLLQLELTISDPLSGDDDVVYSYDGELVVEGIPFPRRVTMLRRGLRYLSVQVSDVSVNPKFADALFEVPHYEALTTTPTTNPMSGGAYEIKGLEGGVFRVFFFDLGDSVAVFDAPGSRSRSQWVEGEIRKAVGDKPIKYVVLSHFHDDHIAGIGYYVDHGAQIVTTRANASIVKRYAIVDSSLHPDLPAEGRSPSFLFVDSDKIDLKGSGGTVLTVYKLADCPHAKDMLVAYLPSEKLLIEADLFVELAAYSATSAAFSTWMAEPSAPPVDWIVGTHLAKVSRESFEKEGRQYRPGEQ
jgi:glyoxylase-like metal-dependent hydrolase (beta-lactamase superfamily II)